MKIGRESYDAVGKSEKGIGCGGGRLRALHGLLAGLPDRDREAGFDGASLRPEANGGSADGRFVFLLTIAGEERGKQLYGHGRIF